jgi:hypothetical protein
LSKNIEHGCCHPFGDVCTEGCSAGIDDMQAQRQSVEKLVYIVSGFEVRKVGKLAAVC